MRRYRRRRRNSHEPAARPRPSYAQSLRLKKLHQIEAQAEAQTRFLEARLDQLKKHVSDEDVRRAREQARREFRTARAASREAPVRNPRKRRYGNPRCGGNKHGNCYDRAKRKARMLEVFGTGKACPCEHCGCRLDKKRLTVDRIVPGASYRTENIVPSCFKCNRTIGEDRPSSEIKRLQKRVTQQYSKWFSKKGGTKKKQYFKKIGLDIPF